MRLPARCDFGRHEHAVVPTQEDIDGLHRALRPVFADPEVKRVSSEGLTRERGECEQGDAQPSSIRH